MQYSPYIVGGLILIAGVLFLEAKRAREMEAVNRVKSFFGKAVHVAHKESFWQKYLANLRSDLSRIGIQVTVQKMQTWIFGTLAGFFLVSVIAKVPIQISLTMVVLLALLPRLIVRELSLRYLINFRKHLVLDVIQTGTQALQSGAALEEVLAEIEQDALSPVIKKEFRLINEYGAAKGIDVAEAMLYRAQMLDIDEFTTLARLTQEGKRRNASLARIWKITGATLWEKIKQQNAIQSAVSAFRMMAIVLFVGLIFFITFGYHALHIHGALQVGVLITLVSYFFGITQIVKTTAMK